MPSILERTVSSSLIFSGTVVQRGNSMEPNLRPSENPDTPAVAGTSSSNARLSPDLMPAQRVNYDRLVWCVALETIWTEIMPAHGR